MTTDFRRIAIVNRGEPAMRLINAVEEYNARHGTDLVTIALYTEPDRRSMFVRRADETFDLGSATFVDAEGQRQVAYLDHARLEDALVRTRAEAVWVGWGFVAEQPAFAELCERLGIVFIGPTSDVMRRLGDKISSKQIAEASDVPVAPWSGGAVTGLEDARAHAARLGYPLMIKATAGGGGRGIRRVDSLEELEQAFDSARAEALHAFGNDTVFLESMLPRAKHIEVQIVGDDAGTVWAVGIRECSVQRRNQKLLEEAPSPSLTPDQDQAIREAAARLGRAAGYRNAGTVEFLFSPDSGDYWFMEVNARLQVEHPVTELTTGLDLVKTQLEIAGGALLKGDPPPTYGHAIEARLNAEDADAGFTPSPGRIELLQLPVGPGIRVDSGVVDGDEIAPEFDSMIAKVIAFGSDRDEALARLRRGLGDTSVVIASGISNKAFLQALLGAPEVADGSADVGWVDRMRAAGEQPAVLHADVALIAAAIGAHREQMSLERGQFRASAARGRPEVDTAVGRAVNLRHRGEAYRVGVFRLAPDAYRLLVDDRSVVVHIQDLGRGRWRLEIRGRSYRVLSSVHGVTHFVEVDGHPHRIAHDEGGVIRSPAPAVTVSIDVAPGDEVEVGDRLIVIEAMKMETVIEASFAGRVDDVLVAANVQVPAGAPLMVVRPRDEGRDASSPDTRISFDAIAAPGQFAHGDCKHYLEAVRQALLGFDVDPALLKTMSNVGATPCPDVPAAAEQRAVEDELLGIFADVIAVFRREPAEVDDDTDALTRRASEEYLFDYLLHTETRGSELPEWFMDQLRRTLAHFGVRDLEPSSELDVALYRLVVSHHRMSTQLAPIVEIIEDRLLDPGGGDAELRRLLDRVVAETQNRYPAVHDLVGELRYRTFDAPFLTEIRERVRAAALADIAALGAGLDESERAVRIEALVQCTQPLTTMLSSRIAEADPELRGALLEVMTRRYYRIRPLTDVRVERLDELVYVAADYVRKGQQAHVVTAHADADALATVARQLAGPIEAFDPDDEVGVDLYVWDAHDTLDEDSSEHLADLLTETLGDRPPRRVVLVISRPGVGTGMSGVLHMTFRPDGDGRYAEDRSRRGLHPMMGKRLELWRLEEFEVERLPSTEDVYVFHGRARDNKRDERLFALAEVRDLTPLNDESGRMVRLPEAERVIHEVVGSIRRFQAHRPEGKRLLSNRIILYVWPTLDLGLDDISELVARLGPDTAGLGIDKVEVLARFRNGDDEPRLMMLEASSPDGGPPQLHLRQPSKESIRPLPAYEQNVVRLRQRGLTYPYELIKLLAPEGDSRQGIPPGEFTEYDFADEEVPAAERRLVPVERPPGGNTANIVVGVVRNRTERYPEGIARVALLGDPTRGMGNLAEPECSRINAAFDLAEELGVPLEWFALSAGAKIAMDSGTENMDWIAAVLRRIIEFTQGGGEVNIVVTGINVGAQPYWNAEATMLMHTRGILIMMPTSAMVLTGKDALDFSGGVSADDNVGIGGYERIMGPNGQAQYFARDLPDACRMLLQHYEYSYVAPGESFARLASTADPTDRDVRSAPHGGQFATVGEVFDEASNPGRKQPFEIRRVMAAAVDQDHPTMERWFGMRDAEVPVVWDAFLGGRPITMIGFESKNLARPGFVPADGPDRWTSGTLFPEGSRKVARAINAASGNRPLVVLANLSGFDGSPESMRERQLEFGAEIGRAIVNFDGPIVFCVVSRYHGGAFVVFSGALNDNFEVAAIEGSKASVIGGAPAAAVVFARDVAKRAAADPQLAELETQLASTTDGAERRRLRRLISERREQAHAEQLGQVADEFDAIHDIARAQRVGSVDRIIAAGELRPYLIDAVERGIERAGAST